MNPLPLRHSRRLDPCRSLAVLALLTGLAPNATTQQPTWSQRVPQTPPPPRYSPGLAFDSTRGVTVLFAGDSGSADLSDTWEWNGTSWTQRAPASIPPPRNSHGLAFDSARSVTTLCGGITYQSGYLADTWEWDGTTWIQRSPANSPPARAFHAMAYDAARGEIVSFGGSNSSGYQGSTWVWDGTNWTQRSPATSPSPRYLTAMAYDAQRQRVLLFGGRDGASSYPADTWEWDGTNWTRRFPANSPAGRHHHALSFDQLRGRVVLFGGLSSAGAVLGDTWEWDGTTWLLRQPQSAPSPRRLYGLAYDSARARTVLFGGTAGANGSRVGLNETWEYFHPTPATAVPFGTPCPGSAGTPSLSAVPGQLPWLGENFDIELANLRPLSTVALLLGGSNTLYGVFVLPQNLGWLGAPLCDLLVSIDASFFGVMSGRGAFRLAIPLVPALAGGRVFAQSLVLDTNANRFGATTTQALDLRLALK